MAYQYQTPEAFLPITREEVNLYEAFDLVASTNGPAFFEKLGEQGNEAAPVTPKSSKSRKTLKTPTAPKSRKAQATPKAPLKGAKTPNIRTVPAKSKVGKATKPAPKARKVSKPVQWKKLVVNQDDEGKDDEFFDEDFPMVDFHDDDPEDSDYVDDEDAKIVDSVMDEKCDYGDLDEEGGRYAVLLKNGEWVEEKKHEVDDPNHKSCVLGEADGHVVEEL